MPVIEVKNISKMYKITQRNDTLRDSLSNLFKKKIKPKTFWALNDVSFNVESEEIIGIIGANGAGKTTLLKILSRITPPTKGEIIVRGRVASLLEVGTGFHQELTGRENIYLNGSILGMKRREIDEKFDEIVSFSGVEKFLDMPVKRYSSGMFVRLAFSVAAHLESEILLIDEVLAVGDVQFRKKCLGKMEEITDVGRTILFVSHDMGAISNLCQKVILLDKGKIREIDDPDIVVGHYIESFKEQEHLPLSERTDRAYDGDVKFTNIRILDSKTKNEIETILSGQNILVEISYEDFKKSLDLNNVNIGLKFFTSQGNFLFVLISQQASKAFNSLPSRGRVYCSIPNIPLTAGNYYMSATIAVNGIRSDHFRNAKSINVEGGDFFGTGIVPPLRSGVYIPHSWYKN